MFFKMHPESLFQPRAHTQLEHLHGKILENRRHLWYRDKKWAELFGPKGTTDKFPLEFAKPNGEMVRDWRSSLCTLQVKAAREAEATKGQERYSPPRPRRRAFVLRLCWMRLADLFRGYR